MVCRNKKRLDAVDAAREKNPMREHTPIGICAPSGPMYFPTEPMPQPILQLGMRAVEQNGLGGRFTVTAPTVMPSTHDPTNCADFTDLTNSTQRFTLADYERVLTIINPIS